MLKKKRLVYTFSLLCGLALPVEKLMALEAYDIEDYRLQLYSDVTPHELGVGENFKPIFYHVQSAGENYLYLGPNEVFFSRVGKLEASGKIVNTDMDLNQGKEFTSIKGFKRQGDTLEWGFITTTLGNISADFFITAKSKDAGTKLAIEVDDQEPIEVTITNKMINDGNFSVNLSNLTSGFHTFKTKIIKANQPYGLKIFNVRLSGLGATNAYVVRERWRPIAMHSSWRSIENPYDVKAWIMEVQSDSDLSHFSPLTTEFGYYGPLFREGGVALGMNMSLWSSGASQPLLPVDKRSHLLGIGSGQATFGSWSHEGVGVKVRNWDNFETNTSKKYVVGLTYSDDGDFRTFSGYFWNEETKKWQLYSIGRVLKKRSLRSLKTRAFIEVPGVAERQRTNQAIREVKYRGWVRDSEGTWSELDQYAVLTGNKLTNKRQGITADGQYFYASAGGLENQMPSNVARQWRQKSNTTKLPLYMKRSKLRAFGKLPFVPQLKRATMNPDGSINVIFKTLSASESTVTICWGETNALTNQEYWDHCKNINFPAGERRKKQNVTIPSSVNDRYLRILVSNEHARMWNFETYDLLN